MNALENDETNSSASSESSTENLSPEEILDNADSEVERNGNTSGFDEKTSRPVGTRLIYTYYTSSESDSYESDDDEKEDEVEAVDGDDSENYFNTGDEDNTDVENELTECENNHDSNTLNNSANATPDSRNLAYQSAYSYWIDLYWNQMTLVQDYVKFFHFTRQQQQNE